MNQHNDQIFGTVAAALVAAGLAMLSVVSATGAGGPSDSQTALGRWGAPATKAKAIVPPVRNGAPVEGTAPRIAFVPNEAEGRLSIRVDGAEAIVYRYGVPNELSMPCFYPVWSPSGKALTEAGRVFPWPHHQSFWFINDVQLEGREKSKLYYSVYDRANPHDPNSPFLSAAIHTGFLPEKQIAPNQAEIGMKQLWRMYPDIALADQEQRVRVVALGGGEYFLDIHYKVTASYGKLTMRDDGIHYSWPMIRMQEAFSAGKGAKVTNSEGGETIFGHHDQVAHWVDTSNTVGGITEGLAIFSHSQNPYPHTWLIRKQGMFGPRRIDSQNGKAFTVGKGESLETRVGVLIHKGDAASGKVAERYANYINGKL